MGKTWDHIPPFAKQIISKQHVFFVATAPLKADGRVNVSPKGHLAETFSLISNTKVAFLDLTGSGVETVAHVKVETFDTAVLGILLQQRASAVRLSLLLLRQQLLLEA